MANEILAYLDVHPRAADTAAGIARFWVAGRYSEEEVENVMGFLVEGERMARWLKPDGRWIYGRSDIPEAR